MKPKFSDPTQADYQRLARQWMAVVKSVRDQYDQEFDQSLASLDVLQRILDEELIDTKNIYGFQCLGVALGRILATNIEGLDWYAVEDEYGRDLTLRYLDTTLQFNVITMISKRVEDGEKVLVHDLYEAVRRDLDELKHEVDR